MSKDTEAKIQRWRRYIDEHRGEAKFLSLEGQREAQATIAPYENLIAEAQSEARKDRGPKGVQSRQTG
jgi:hypothetical protein